MSDEAKALTDERLEVEAQAWEYMRCLGYAVLCDRRCDRSTENKPWGMECPIPILLKEITRLNGVVKLADAVADELERVSDLLGEEDVLLVRPVTDAYRVARKEEK